MAAPSEPLVATEFNITLSSADTEFSQALPVGTKYFSIQCRAAVVCRFSFTTGKVAGPTAPYTTLKSGGSYNSPEKLGANPTIYLATTDVTSPVIEILAWSSPTT